MKDYASKLLPISAVAAIIINDCSRVTFAFTTNIYHGGNEAVVYARRKPYLPRVGWSALGLMKSSSAVSGGRLGKIPDKLPDGCKVGEVLSSDPLVFTVENLLSEEECQSFIDRASSSTELVRSNAPEAGVEISRLWPLPFLIVGAGVPSALRVYLTSQESSDASFMDLVPSMLSAALLPLSVATAVVSILVFAVNILAKKTAENSRTSSSVALNKDEDCDFIRPFMDRSQKITGHEWARWEAPVVTRYKPGESFGLHNDASPTRGSEWADRGGQRIVTMITYLNDVPIESGGQTRFDKLRSGNPVDVQPVRGKSCVFFPADDQTLEMDDRTRHESIVMQASARHGDESEKWIVQLFGRIERVPPPLGIPDSFAAKRR